MFSFHITELQTYPQTGKKENRIELKKTSRSALETRSMHIFLLQRAPIEQKFHP